MSRFIFNILKADVLDKNIKKKYNRMLIKM